MVKRNRLPDPPFLILGTLEGTNYPLTVSGEAFAKHKHILGVSGSGKSYLLVWIVLHLLKQNISFSLIDPHADTARLLLAHLIGAGFFKDPRFAERLLYVDFSSRTDHNRAIPFNILKQPYPAHTTAQNVLEAIQRAFPATVTTTNIDNVILTGTMILISANLPFTELPRLILDKSFREALLTRTMGLNPLSVQFFKQKLEDKSFVGAAFIDSALKRSFLLTFAPAISNCLGMRENRLNFKAFIDQGTSVIYNLGGLDEASKRFIGCLLMTGMEQAFLSRAGLTPAQRTPHHLLVDEAPLFMSQSEVSFTNMLESIRKQAGTLYLSGQTISQLNPRVTGSLQNAMSILLRLGTDDSGWAASRYFLPPPEPKPESLKEIFRDMASDFFGLERAPEESLPNAFANTGSRDEARRLYESLERQAIAYVRNTPVLVKIPTLPPPRVTPAELKSIEDTYAALLLEPVSSSSIDKKVVHFPDPDTPPRARRRSP